MAKLEPATCTVNCLTSNKLALFVTRKPICQSLAEEMANSEDSDWTAPKDQSFRICTVCLAHSDPLFVVHIILCGARH